MFFSPKDSRNSIPHIYRQERHQDAVKALRVWIDGDDQLSPNILCSVRDDAVLPGRDNEVLLGEEHSRQEAPIEELDFEVGRKRSARRLRSLTIGGVLALILAKVA